MASRDSHPQDSESPDNDFHPTTTHHPSYSNQFPQYSRPLIDSARNSWQPRATGGSQHASSPPADDIKSPGWPQMALSVAFAPRFRYMLIYGALFIFAWIGWRMLLSPQLQDQNSLLHSSPHADGLVRIRTLDPGLVPGDMPKVDLGKTSRKRLIFVGDVHGCKDECKKYPLNHVNPWN